MICWTIFLVLLPFQEGSGSAQGLFIAHLALLVAISTSMPRLGKLRGSLAIPAVAVLAVSGFSGAVGNYRFASLLALADLAAALGVLVVLEARIRGRPLAMAPLLQAVALGGLAQALQMLYAFARGGSALGAGTMLNSDHAAAYLLLACWSLLALGRFSFRGGSAARALWAATMIAAALAQASRGALVALVASGAFYIALRFKAMPRAARRGTLAAAVGMLLLAGAFVAHRFATEQDPYRWDRIQLWSVAVKVARLNWIAGVGPGVYAYVTPPFDFPGREGPVRFGKSVEATHSDYLRIPAETGLVGTLAFLLLAFGLGRATLRALRRGGGAETALGAGLVGLLAQMTVENLSARPAVFYTGAAIAAMIAAQAPGLPHRDADTLQQNLPRGRRRAALLLVNAGLVWAGLVFVVAPYLGHNAFQAFLRGGPAAAERLAAAVFWNPLHPEYRAVVGRAVLAESVPAPAHLALGLTAASVAIGLEPIGAEYHLLRARLARKAFQAGDGAADWITMADESYKEAARLDPLRPQAHVERGWMLLATGAPREALASSELAIEAEPNSYEARRLRVAALSTLGDREAARREIAEARRRRSAIGRYLPWNDYERAVLRWDETAWEGVEERVNAAARRDLN